MTALRKAGFASLVFLLVLGTWMMLLADPNQPDPYEPIPAGFDFPADATKLEKFIKDQNVSQMRLHMWNVWAGINQPAQSGGPIWETWYSQETAFQTGPTPEGVRKIERHFIVPRQFKVPGPQPEAVGQALLSFVLYNKDNYDHIRSNKYYLRQTLTDLNNSFGSTTPIADRRIKDFPNSAVSLKTVWWIVKKEGLTTMPILDFDPDSRQTHPFPSNKWKRCVLVDPTRTSVPEGESQQRNCNGLTQACHVVPLNSFYHFPISTQTELAAARMALPNLNTHQPDVDGPAPEMGDHVALVAMHVTTKEIGDWVWATFWWHDKPNDGPFAQDRPDKVKDVWRNYLMDVSYDMDIPHEPDGKPHACMNPWLEARFANGMVSNCMTCHQKSVWQQLPGSPPDGVPFLPVTRGGLKPDDPIFKNRIKLDFLWSVGDLAQ